MTACATIAIGSIACGLFALLLAVLAHRRNSPRLMDWAAWMAFATIGLAALGAMACAWTVGLGAD